MKPLVAAAATEAELVPKVRDVRARISFYASTPQYRAAFDASWAGRSRRRAEAAVARAALGGDAAARSATRFCTPTSPSAPTTRSREKLTQRYGKVVTHCEFSIPVKDEADKERLRVLAKTIQAN